MEYLHSGEPIGFGEKTSPALPAVGMNVGSFVGRALQQCGNCGPPRPRPSPGLFNQENLFLHLAAGLARAWCVMTANTALPGMAYQPTLMSWSVPAASMKRIAIG